MTPYSLSMIWNDESIRSRTWRFSTLFHSTRSGLKKRTFVMFQFCRTLKTFQSGDPQKEAEIPISHSFVPISVNDCIEGQTVPPRVREVGDFNTGVASRRLLCPPEQRLFGRYILLTDNNIRDLQIKCGENTLVTGFIKGKSFACICQLSKFSFFNNFLW